MIVSEAKTMFENYANDIVKILKSKKLRMVKKQDSDNSCWQSYKKDNGRSAMIDIRVNCDVGSDYISVGFNATILYPKIYLENFWNRLEERVRKKTEKEIANKYSLNNLTFFNTKKIETPILKPVEEVAEQLSLAVTCYNKINRATSKIKRAQKRIDELYKKETDEILESLIFSK